jgi:hypothetical protein
MNYQAARCLLIVALFLLSTGAPTPAQVTNRAPISGKVIYKTSKKPVDDAAITSTEIKEGAVKNAAGPADRSDGNGLFTLEQAPVGVRISIAVTKFNETTGEVFRGQTKAEAKLPPKKSSPAPDPVEVSLQAQTGKLRPSESSMIVVLTAFRIPFQVDAAKAVQSDEKKTVSGVIKADDQKQPGKVRITLVNLKTGAVVYDELIGLVHQEPQSNTARKNDFEIKLTQLGYYNLAILAENYEPVNYLIVKNSPQLLYVFNNSGLRFSDASKLFVMLMPVAASELAEEQEQLIETDVATRHASFGPRLMQTLPVEGTRSFDTFALLVPGVLPPPQSLGTNGPGVSPGVGTQGQFAVNGLRSRENNFNVDGSDNNDEDIGVRRQGFVFLVPQSIESVQEFQILTALPDARFGRNAGGQVNALTQTGKVNLHGSVYGFFTDSRLNGRDFFNRADHATAANVPLRRQSDNAPVLLDGQPLVPRPPSVREVPLTRVQAGLTIGGPLEMLQRTYFFGSLEEQVMRGRKKSHFAVPTVRQRGLFDSGDTGLLSVIGVGNPPLFPASIPGDAIFSLFPFPNNARGPYGENTYTTDLPADGHGTRFSVKLDHQFHRDKHERKGNWLRALFTTYGDQVTGRYNFTDDRSTLPVTGGALFSALRPKVRTQNVAFFLNRTLSGTMSDVVRFSFGRTRLFFGEVRDPALVPSDFFPTTPFLLNAPLLLNVTAPNVNGTLNSPRYLSAASSSGAGIMTSLGYSSFETTEQITGPLGQIIIPGFSPLGVDTEHFPQERANNTFQFADTVTYLRGKQVITFGVDVRKVQINSTLERNFRPRAVFNGLPANLIPGAIGFMQADGTPLPTNLLTGLTNAAAGVPTGFFQTLAAVPNPSIGIRFTQVNVFAQQTRNVFSHRFRVTLGLRYELNTVPDTVGQLLENAFDPQLLRDQAQSALQFCSPAVRCNDLIPALTAAFPADFKVSFGADRNDLDARLGAAWQAKNGRSVLRGGFGYYDGQYPGIVLDQSRNAFSAFLPLNLANFALTSKIDSSYLFNLANPNVQQFTFSPITPGTLNTFPGLKPNSVPSTNPITLLTSRLAGAILGLDLVLPQRALKTPYAMHYGLTLEHQFKSDYLVSIAYVGTRGVKLLRVSNPDRGLNNSSIGGLKLLASKTPGLPFPIANGVMSPPQSTIISQSFAIARTLFESSAQSTYNSLQLELRKRYSRGRQFGSAFTYSHAIDDVSDFFDMAGAFALPQNSLQRSERADANFDVRLRSVTYFVLGIPTFLRAGLLLRDWEVSGVVTAQSGQPYTVNSAVDVNHDGNLTDRLNTTDGLLRTGGHGPVQLRLAPGVNPSSLLAAAGFDGAIGRNTFRAPGMFTIDVAFIRDVPIQDNLHLKFRVELFNLLNSANYGIPVRILEAPGFGTSTNTTAPARTLQFAMKFQF